MLHVISEGITILLSSKTLRELYIVDNEHAVEGSRGCGRATGSKEERGERGKRTKM